MQTHSNFVDKTEGKFKQYDTHLKNNKAFIRNIKIQLGQISKQLSERPQGFLLSNMIINPREQVNAITLRSGKELGELEKPRDEEPSIETKKQARRGGKYEIPMKCSKEVGDEEKKSIYVAPPTYDLPITYPQRVKLKNKEETERQYFKFLEVFKKLHINILLLEALEQMPIYAKFMKNILSLKRKLKHDETIVLNEEFIHACLLKLLIELSKLVLHGSSIYCEQSII